MEDLNINIPLFRAEIKDNSRDEEYMKGFVKIINGKIYAIGYYSKGHIEVTVGDTTRIFPIKKETLAISFRNMLDVDNDRVFISLNNSGTGGDRLKNINHIYQEEMPIFIPCYDEKYMRIFDIPLDYGGTPKLHTFKVIGVQQ